MEKNKSLYNINEDQLMLIAEIEAMEGEITPEMEEKLAITEGQLKQKSIAYLEVIAVKDAFNSKIDEEIKRLQALKKRNNNTVTRLKDTLLVAVKTFGDFEIGTQKFGTRKSSSVNIIDAEKVPAKFKTITTTTSISKADVKKAINNGEEVPGAEVVENKNLKIN